MQVNADLNFLTNENRITSENLLKINIIVMNLYMFQIYVLWENLHNWHKTMKIIKFKKNKYRKNRWKPNGYESTPPFITFFDINKNHII